jgi:hypothetical protein
MTTLQRADVEQDKAVIINFLISERASSFKIYRRPFVPRSRRILLSLPPVFQSIAHFWEVRSPFMMKAEMVHRAVLTRKHLPCRDLHQ